nr:formyltransferase family protein [Variovorax sp. dw_954]
MKINEHTSELKELAPDLIFVVGLSQLISREILQIPRLGCVGFHPTALPRGRGRAPIAWLTLRCESGAATFFRLQEGADDGEIFVQQPFDVDASDSAASVEQKILNAERCALDTWLPSIALGLNGVEQAHEAATFYGMRKPEDGVINWQVSATVVDRLVKAAGRPHPGAFTYQEDEIIRIWSTKVDAMCRHVGVPGRILEIKEDRAFLIQCGDTCLWVEHWSAAGPWLPKVGMRLGYYVDSEVNQLRRMCVELNARIEVLEARLNNYFSILPG